MAFLKRLICCGSAGRVKYDDDRHTQPSRGRPCLPCSKVKWKSQTAPASTSSDDSPACSSGEHARSMVATVVIEESPAPTTPTPPSTRHKSYSSVSSIGRKLVEKLADEVVEDFMELEMGMPYDTMPCSTQDNEDPVVESRIRIDSQDVDLPETIVVEENVPYVVDNNKVDLPETSTDLIDSAREQTDSFGDGSFDEKRAFFEGLNRERMDGMRTTPVQAVEHRDHEDVDRSDTPDSWSGGVRKLSFREENVVAINKSLSRVASGRSWILDPVIDSLQQPQPQQQPNPLQQQPKQQHQQPATPVIIQNDLFGEEAKRTGEHQQQRHRHYNQQQQQLQQQQQESRTCVVRKVFHAAHLASEGDTDSSDGSVISVEIMSVPRNGNDEERNNGRALEWFLPLITDKKQSD